MIETATPAVASVEGTRAFLQDLFPITPVRFAVRLWDGTSGNSTPAARPGSPSFFATRGQ